MGTPSSKVTEPFCRVPSTYFYHHLGFVNLSTCVGFSTVFLILIFFLQRRKNNIKPILYYIFSNLE
jgi:hypothetical protein